MIRTPLRPLARVISARENGENPDVIEAEERVKRNQVINQKIRKRAEHRLTMLGLAFFIGFGAIAGKMGMLAVSEPMEPRLAVANTGIHSQRADIVDRNGSVLATNLVTTSLYAQPHMMIEPVKAADKLAKIFPDINHDKLLKQFTGKRKFVWVRKKVSPEQKQLVHDIGEPGLLFGPREMRLYPNGKLAAHILGGAGFGKEDVRAAELIGVAGVEKFFDERMRDPAQVDTPLKLSIDLTAQATMRRVVEGGMKIMNAKGAAAVLMDVHTGEIVSMVSLPDFDPNDRPAPLLEGDPSDSPLFNRAAQGVYELGSTFKLFAAAVSLDNNLANEDTMINTKGPIRWGKFKIRDFHNYGNQLSVKDVIVKSSNIGTARMAQAAGTNAQKKILDDLGFFAPVPVEISEAKRTKPLLPAKWSDLSTMTISYGHGIAATPLHLATAYATLANGGYKVKPTLLKSDVSTLHGDQVLKKTTSDSLMRMLRAVVTEGTASFGEVDGYHVGGKTGSADKPKPNGGYYDDKVIATFASAFPTHDPKYVLVLTLDEPSIEAAGEERRTAGWTAVPVAAELITRVAPVLNMRPELAGSGQVEYTQAKHQ
ncbi:penicillin-binding protein 2 [Amylibacter sp. SFDW26]|uniref:peptidoglycan D,D-transpeptidase FtsI family protein n=1 Tax=Amylibacter sp. SFDW26 TaxID=2652722 RepID=UPI001261A1D4|nr:penicillin-binding protein 2 [Amylibacter sp. SFDW26]KAB7610340.1 penicillin-binding protein 2 [Amylibacter sp. SFDW26]